MQLNHQFQLQNLLNFIYQIHQHLLIKQNFLPFKLFLISLINGIKHHQIRLNPFFFMDYLYYIFLINPYILILIYLYLKYLHMFYHNHLNLLLHILHLLLYLLHFLMDIIRNHRIQYYQNKFILQFLQLNHQIILSILFK